MPVDYAGIMRITVGDTNYDAACGYEDTGLYDSGIDRRLGKELCGTDMAGVRKLLCTAGGGRARKPVPYIGRNKPDTAKLKRADGEEVDQENIPGRVLRACVGH